MGSVYHYIYSIFLLSLSFRKEDYPGWPSELHLAPQIWFQIPNIWTETSWSFKTALQKPVMDATPIFYAEFPIRKKCEASSSTR